MQPPDPAAYGTVQAHLGCLALACKPDPPEALLFRLAAPAAAVMRGILLGCFLGGHQPCWQLALSHAMVTGAGMLKCSPYCNTQHRQFATHAKRTSKHSTCNSVCANRSESKQHRACTVPAPCLHRACQQYRVPGFISCTAHAGLALHEVPAAAQGMVAAALAMQAAYALACSITRPNSHWLLNTLESSMALLDVTKLGLTLAAYRALMAAQEMLEASQDGVSASSAEDQGGLASVLVGRADALMAQVEDVEVLDKACMWLTAVQLAVMLGLGLWVAVVRLVAVCQVAVACARARSQQQK